MNGPTEKKDVCPPVDDVSAWTDGEGDQTVGDHIRGCPVCTSTVNVYRRLDAAVRSAAAAPSDLAARISSACRSTAVNPPVIGWPLLLVRSAAVVAVLLAFAGVISLSMMFGNKDVTLAENSAVGPGVSAPPVAASDLDVADVVPDPVGTPDTAADGEVRANGNPIAVETLALANTAGATGRPVRIPKAGTGTIRVGQRVRHVWVVKDPQTEYGDLVAWLSQAELGASSVAETKDAAGVVSFGLAVADTTAQQIVDRLADRGGALISPDYPQPGRAAALATSGRTVLYEAQLVRGD